MKFESPRMSRPLKPFRLPWVSITLAALLTRSKTSRGRSCSICLRVMVSVWLPLLWDSRNGFVGLPGWRSERPPPVPPAPPVEAPGS